MTNDSGASNCIVTDEDEEKEEEEEEEEEGERRGRESNPRIGVLQTPALPLGYPASERGAETRGLVGSVKRYLVGACLKN
jgi:hypothetical protein